MRVSRVHRYALREATANYARYFDHAEQELPALQQLFPHTTCDRHDVARFHAALCATMRERGCAFAGVKVMPPSCEALQALHTTTPICVPLFTNMLGDGDQHNGSSSDGDGSGNSGHDYMQEQLAPPQPIAVRQHRLQYVEGCVVLRMGDALAGNVTAEAAALRCAAFAVGIELTGTRFPFYPPTLSSLACDLGSCVKVVLGSSNAMASSLMPLAAARKRLLTHCFVLTHNDEPVQVGCGKNCLGDPFVAVATAAAYAAEMQQPLQRGHVVVCAGASARCPARVGKYVAQWGPCGTAACTLV